MDSVSYTHLDVYKRQVLSIREWNMWRNENMRKEYVVKDLCCAHCAQKIQNKVSKLKGVELANLNVMSQRLVIDVQEAYAEGLTEQVKQIVAKIEPECTVLG